MRRIFLQSLLLPVILLGTSAFTSAFADEQNRTLPAFKSIKSRSAFNLQVEVGKTQSIQIKGNEKFLANVVTEVFGDELVISYKEKNSIKVSDNAQVIISVPELVRFKMEGAGKTTLNNISGSHFTLLYEGAGMLTATGKVKSFTLKAQGVGLVEAKDLIAEQVDASVEGVGAVTVNARDNLNASVQGIGTLTYYGHPRNVSKSVEGIGSVRAGD
ncbi:GIN domain-containing protein [Undibacterium sp. Di26W]|uniref:GIN domain-containing protein n=1 Tax=Undibacterium sp. Di26W TaxID=3413035 RepID=UPI003BEFBC63